MIYTISEKNIHTIYQVKQDDPQLIYKVLLRRIKNIFHYVKRSQQDFSCYKI